MRSSTSRVLAIAVAVLVLAVLVPSIGAATATSSSNARPNATAAPGSADPLASAERSLAQAQGPAAGGAMECGGGSSGATCHTPASSNSSEWWVAGPGSSAPASWSPGTGLLADDPAVGGVVFLDSQSGGYASNGPTSTWVFAQGAWTNLSLAIGPVACGNARSGLAYDAAAAEIVLLQGTNCTQNSTTWTFAHDVWTELSVGVHPSGEAGVVLPIAYDPTDEDVYVVTNGTWSFANGTWTDVGASPLVGYPGTMAYDSTSGTLVLTSPSDNATWTWGTSGWTAIGTTAGPSTWMESGVDDPSIGGVEFFGVSLTGTFAWTLVSGTWSQVSLPAGVAALGSVGAVDTSSSTLLVVGTNPPPQRFVVTWEEAAGVWTNATVAAPPPLTGASLAYDAADSEVVLFGGYGSSCPSSNASFCNATWTYANGSWTELPPARSPSPREIAAMTYDASDGYVVLFGGIGPDCPGGEVCADTWEFVGGAWSEITPPIAPPGASSPAGFAYDPLEGYSVLFDAPGGTWAFHGGNWTNLSATAGAPPGAPASNLVYDPAAGAVVLVGTYMTGVAAVDPTTWLFANGTWSALPGATNPPARGSSAIAYDPSLAAVLLFGGYNFTTDAELNDTWELANGSWSERFGPGGPPAQSYAAATDDPGAGTVVLVGTAWWTWGNVSATGPSFAATLTADPNPAEVGAPLQLSTGVSGGTAPFSYTYGGLPTGCTSQNASTVGCTPTASGPFAVTVTVVDATGNGTEATVSLIVEPALQVTLVALPSTVAVGARTLLETNASSGEGPYFYAYTQLPGGCSTESIPTLPCTPSQSGTYAVVVTVTDGVGVSVPATAHLSVVSGGAPGAPAISEFNASPDDLVLGNDTVLSVGASDGGAPLTYSYTGLPPGCDSANVSQLACTPTTAGAYPISVDVQAPDQRFSVANLTLDVVPAGGIGRPYVLAFAASPSVIELGEGTTFVVTTNASYPLTFAYLDLPSGCTSANVTRLSCGPRTAGNFTVEVAVANRAGNRTVVATTLDVLATAAPPTGPTAGSPSDLSLWLALTAAVAVAAGIAAAWAGDRAARRRHRQEGEGWVRELTGPGGPPREPPP